MGGWNGVDGALGQVTKYYFADGRRIAMREGSAGDVTYLYQDHLGSASLAVGASTTAQRYTPYGEARYGSVPTDYQFTGQRSDCGVGLYYYGARYYDPVAGRFISADAIVPSPGNPQSLNRYAYVRNNPLRYRDPTGRIEEDEEADADSWLAWLAKTYGITVIRDYGWRIGYNEKGPYNYWAKGAWEISDLVFVARVVSDLAYMMGGADTLKQRLGGVWMDRNAGDNGGLGGPHSVSLGKNLNEWTVVHELAHAWDGASWGRLSWDLMSHTGGYYHLGRDEWSGATTVHYHPRRYAPPRAPTKTSTISRTWLSRSPPMSTQMLLRTFWPNRRWSGIGTPTTTNSSERFG